MNQSMGPIGVSNLIGWRGDAAGDGEGEALDIAAGDNRCGLISGVCTRDIDGAFRHSEEMPTGTVEIDDESIIGPWTFPSAASRARIAAPAGWAFAMP
jgi:hypothetical protein